MHKPKYNIKVRLTGKNGNAFNLMGIVTAALKKANVPKVETDKFLEEAMSGNYQNLLRVCGKWVHMS